MRRLFLFAIGAAVSWALPGQGAADDGDAWHRGFRHDLTHISQKYMVTPHEARAWHLFKDEGGPTFSGSPSWRRYLDFMEQKLRSYGVVDIVHNAWTYDRWSTAEWPGDGRWSLTSDGEPVKVASYGAYSGSTGDGGVTAPLAFYDPAKPPKASDLAGKIVVFQTAPHPKPPFSAGFLAMYTTNDYEFRTDSDTFAPLFTDTPVSETVTSDVWYQLGQVSGFIRTLRSSAAAGAIFVFDASYDRMAGLYTFGVPTLYSAPSLYLDRVAGAKVLQDAKDGKTANLRLLASVESAETYQLVGYLPGSHYGTPEDEQVLLISHTDGPAISQENGALGVLAVVHYFAHVPPAARPRTLMVFLDNRHYMPGAESAFAAYDWFTLHPEAAARVVASIGTEHLGQIEYREVGERFEPTGQVEPSFLWARNNPILVDMAIAAAVEHRWPRCQVQAPERPGIHGQMQGVWYGMGSIASKLKVPGFATMGSQGAYWTTTARIDKFDPDLFVTEVSAMAQLTGGLMVADLVAVDPVWGILRTAIAGLADTGFADPAQAATQRGAMLALDDAAFEEVRERDYGDARERLSALEGAALAQLVEPSRSKIAGQIDAAAARLPAER